jgi:hypothetical protein
VIISKIIGGFGNQLFQFALGYALSQQNRTSHLLDVSSFDSYKLRRFELLRFHLPCKLGSVRMRRLKGLKVLTYVPPLNLQVSQRVLENGLAFQPELLKLTGSLYLEGYFQNEKYFREHKSTFQNIFISEKALNPKSKVQNWLSDIKSSESCAIHVRRGDYINNPETRKVHFVCDLSYFEKAMKQMESKHPNVQFYCFTDDVAWAETNLGSKSNLKVVQISNGDFYSDFYLMNQCRHSIICNSTFSWWATWLRPQEGSVIAPNRWFNLAEYNKIEIVPERWQQLEP